jgi:hypothetical protein
VEVRAQKSDHWKLLFGAALRGSWSQLGGGGGKGAKLNFIPFNFCNFLVSNAYTKTLNHLILLDMKPKHTFRKIALLPVTFLLFTALAFVINPTPGIDELVLNAAIKAGDVTAEVTSNGKYSGRTVNLKLTNTTSKKITIQVPAGTAYAPANEDEQTLFQLEDEFIVLEPKATKVHTIAAFCSESSDGIPTEGSNFKITTATNKKLDELAAYVKGKKLPKTSYQEAVWAVSDNASVACIEASTPESKAFRQFVADLTGQTNTWYTATQNYTVTPQRRIVALPTIVRGQVSFASDGVSVIRQEVVDKNGVVRFEMPPATPKKSVKCTMDFSVKVSGWEKGDYTLRIVMADVELKTYPFTI